MKYQALNFADKLNLFNEHWSPKLIAEMNGYQFKVVKVKGDFVWHDHQHTDETFIVLSGILRIDFRDGHVHVQQSEMYVVPKGVEHKSYAQAEVEMLLIEPGGTPNAGEEVVELIAKSDVWISAD